MALQPKYLLSQVSCVLRGIGYLSLAAQPNPTHLSSGVFEYGRVVKGNVLVVGTTRLQLKEYAPEGSEWKDLVVEKGKILRAELVRPAIGLICAPIPTGSIKAVYKPSGRLTGLYLVEECERET